MTCSMCKSNDAVYRFVITNHPDIPKGHPQVGTLCTSTKCISMVKSATKGLKRGTDYNGWKLSSEGR